MQGLRVVNRRNIVVVDGLDETAEVLKAVLEPRGCDVTRVRSDGKPQAGDSHTSPCVIVFHEPESLRSSFRPEWEQRPAWQDVPRIVIGRTLSNSASQERVSHFLPQPFQYVELVGAIESLLSPL